MLFGTIAAEGDYAIDAAHSTCASDATLAANSSCVIALTFTPTALGLRSGGLTINDNAGNAPQVVALSGTGIAGPLHLKPSALYFGKVVMGLEKDIALTLRNPNRAPLQITAIRSGLADYRIGSGCVGLLPAGGSCSVMVSFAPSSAGRKPATLLIDDDAAHSPQVVKLTGRGKMPALSRSPTIVRFGRVHVGDAPVVRNVTLTNRSPVAIDVAALTSSGPAFEAAPTCVGSLPPPTVCSFTVSFTSGAAGTIAAQLGIVDDAAQSRQLVTLKGIGMPPSSPP